MVEKRGEGKNLLVTGGTGFLGKTLVDVLLEKTNHKLYLLTRNNKNVLSIYQENPRIKIIQGDISKSEVITNKEVRKTLDKTIDEVIHSAALVGFKISERNNTIATNLGGTQNLLEITRNFEKLKCFNYISTTYVCGLLQDPNTFTENLWFDGGKNPYEESKQMTEHYVSTVGLPYTILRPSIIVGSEDGKYYDTKTIYAIFTGILLGKLTELKKQGLDRENILKNLKFKAPIAGNSQTAKNIIPVDILSEIIVRIIDSPNKEGKIYHLCNPENFPAKYLIERPAKVLNIEGLHYLSDEKINGNISRAVKRMHSFTGEFVDYLSMSDPEFDLSNTINLVGQEIVDKIPKPTPEFLDKLYSHFLEKHYNMKAD